MIRLSLKNKTALLTITMLFLLMGCITIGIWGLRQIHICEHHAEIADKIHYSFNELCLLFEKTLMGPHDFLIHGNKNEKDVFAADYKKLVDTTENIKRKCTETENLPVEIREVLGRTKAIILKVKERLPEFRMVALEILTLDFIGESYKAGFYMEEMDLSAGEIQSDLQKGNMLLTQLEEKSRSQIHEIYTRVQALFLLFGITALFFATLLGWYLVRSITLPLSNLLIATEKITNGDLAVRAKVETNDELGELAVHFNTMVNELAIAQEHMSEIFQGSGSAMWVIDKDFNICNCNAQMEAFIGVPHEKTAGKKCYELFSNRSCGTENCVMRRIFRGEERIEKQTIKETIDGRRIPVELVATTFKKEGKAIGVIESFRDITNQKAAEDALRQGEEKLEGIVSSITDHMSMMDSEYNIVWANDVAKRLFGPDLDGKKCYRAYHGYEKHCEPCIVKKTFEDGKSHEHETQVITPNGTRMSFWCTASVALRNEDETPRWVVEVSRNITERQQAEEELKTFAKRLEQMNHKLKENQAHLVQSEKMASIGQLAAGVAHEINNPVGFVTSNLGTLADYVGTFKELLVHYERLTETIGTNNIEQQKDILKQIEELIQKEDLSYVIEDIDHLLSESQEGTHRVKEIIQNLKDFARADEGELKEANINDGIEATLKIVWNELKYKCEVKKELGELPLIPCYLGQLNQVFMNLLVNAAQAIRERGEITIRTETVDGEVVIKITDTGEGIPPERLSKVFDPFFTTKPVGEGTGLGLAISYGIVEKHNGTIEVESELGKGTTFTLRLPTVGYGE
ncbi:MAG: ATP-binding protein [Pseudomonadota bacterium]